MPPDRIPLFPLNVVLFPGEQLPLHIFEPRYRRMVGECLELKSSFGMLLALPDGIVRVGCTAQIVQVSNRDEDGRMDIVTAGRRPFRVVELFTKDPLLEATVDFLDDQDSALDPTTQGRLVGLYSEFLSYAVAGALPLDLLCKQQILELRSEAERQDRLLRYLGEWALHLQKVDTQRQRGVGNGHGLN